MNTLSFSKGEPIPLGASIKNGSVNFAIYAPDVKTLTLHIFETEYEDEPCYSFSFSPQTNKTGHVWHAKVQGLGSGALYLFSIENDGEKRYILDPYFKCLSNTSIFTSSQVRRDALKRKGQKVVEEALIAKDFPKCVVVDDEFSWLDDKRPYIPYSKCVIYECHVKGMSAMASIPKEERGTYAGILHLIPYLKKLGITSLEFLPIFEFDEYEIDRISPSSEEKLKNYWGYSPLSFFAPKASYAKEPKNAVNEFKHMVNSLHKAGIEVILDVVFNHTAEGGDGGHSFLFKCLSLSEYYIVEKGGRHTNYSGCGNTFCAYSEVGKKIIIDSLVYWVQTMHVDGFRFDLAPILAYQPSNNGIFADERSVLLQEIASHPLLQGIKLIAEPWDAGHSYMLGHFPSTWLEWNDKYRDTWRRFWLWGKEKASNLINALQGSRDVFDSAYSIPSKEEYLGNSSSRSINFISCHDGFTLKDVVSYNQKHNEANGEDNRDGSDANFSYNHGVEGDAEDAKIIAMRERQIKNLLFPLFAANGVPMLLMGDEFMHSQKGNNNAYCQDNELSYLDYSLLDKHKNLFDYTKNLIALKKTNIFALLYNSESAEYFNEIGNPIELNRETSFISCLAKKGKDACYVIFNSLSHDVTVRLPKGSMSWHVIIDTSMEPSISSDLLATYEDAEEKDKDIVALKTSFPLQCSNNGVYISCAHSLVLLSTIDFAE